MGFERSLLKKHSKTCIFNSIPSSQKPLIYLATARAPGASKSTVLETNLKSHPHFIYIDPDQRTLKFLIHTYVKSLNNYAISQASSYKTLAQKQYLKWRDASNYIAYNLLNEAYDNNFSIAHGTTSTKKDLEAFFR